VPGVGIYHEAYLVRPGEYEVVYRNMPRTGLARVGRVVSVSARAGFGGLWGRAAHGRRCAAETAARVPHTPCSDPPRPAPPRPAPPRPAPPRPAPPRPAPPRPAPPHPARQASEGRMRTGAGRLGRTDGGDHAGVGYGE
jgi:hypothetical protein